MAVRERNKRGSRRGTARVPKRAGFLDSPTRRWAAAAAVVVIIVAAWFGTTDHNGRHSLSEQTLAPVRTAVETASGNGWIVYPGGQNNLNRSPAPIRAGISPTDSPLDESLESLYETFSTNKTHRDAAYWLITGYLAAGRIETAWDFAREAHGLYPHDAGMIALNALAAYVNGDYEGAEKLFREALELAPDDPVILVNFSLVLIDLNKPDEARSLLEMITDHHAATPIATRARRIDEELIGGQ